MPIVFLFGIVLTLSSLTAWRGESAASPIDIAMVGLALLSFILAFRPNSILQTSIYRHSPTRNLFNNPVAQFVLLSFPVLVVSTILNINQPYMKFNPMGREVISLAASMLCVLAAVACLVSRYRNMLLAGLCIGNFGVGLVYLVLALSGLGYNEDGRFTGGSVNPNQTALHALIAIVVSYCVLRFISPRKLAFRAMLAVTIICGFGFGIASSSDAFRGAALLIALAISLQLSRLYLGSYLKGVVAFAFGGIAALSLAQAHNPDFLPDIWNSTVGGIRTGNQDLDRLYLWHNGILAWREHIFFGNGIGAWSGLAGPYEGIEAHNSFIDWLSMSGLAGGILYTVMLLKIFYFSLKKEPDRYLLFVSILLYTLFGFFFRNPLYWIGVSMLLLRYDSGFAERAAKE